MLSTLSEPDVLDVHREFQETRSPESREWLVRHYEGLAFQLASRASRQSQERDDLRQVAMLGLLKALDRFDLAHGTAFSTFAWATISGELKRYRRDRDWSLHVPRRLQEVYLRTSGALEYCTHELGRSPTTAEIAASTGDPEEDVIESLAVREAYRPASLDVPARSDGEGGGIEVGEVDGGFAGTDEQDRVERLIAMLPEREQRIVRLRFFAELTQSQIAEAVGLSQMQVSRLLSKSLDRLRRWSQQSTRAEVP